MKRNLFGLAGAILVAASVVAAQAPNPQDPQTQTKSRVPDVTVTGCLAQGSTPTSFVLNNARLSTDDKSAAGKSYQLVADASAKDLNFKAEIGHQVSITGVAEAKTATPPPPGQTVNEKDFPKLTAKSVSMVSDRCTQ